MLFFSKLHLADDEYGWDYNAFTTGSVTVRSIDGAVTVDLVRVSNTQKGWQEATINRPDCMCRIYEVDLSETEVTDTHIENLQYFFIRADRVKNPGYNSPQLGLLIHGREDDILRARTYLSMLGADNARYNLLYRVNDPESKLFSDCCSPIHMPANNYDVRLLLPGRLMPLLHIVSPSPKYVQYSGDVSLAGLCSTEERGSNSFGAKLTAEELQSCYEVYPDAKDIPWKDSVQNLCLLYWKRTLQSIVGIDGKKLNEVRKEKVRKQLTDYVLEKRKHMSLLAELCWFFNLHALMEDKAILRRINDQVALDEPVLLQSYLDALNYTDGIMQLLENSCQHTLRKSSYMNMRLLLVKREVTDRQLIKNMRTRETLMKRYEELSGLSLDLDTKAAYYVDISVVDDARYSATSLQGLLKVFRDNAKIRYNLTEEALPQTLADVFSDERRTIDTLESLPHHYGLDSLKQVIAKNGGVFLVSSPYTEKNPNAKETEVVLYPIPKDEKKLPKPHKNLDETTEYHILYPLGASTYRKTMVTSPSREPNSDLHFHFELKDLTNWDIETRKYTFESFFPEDTVTPLYLDQKKKITKIRNAFSLFRQQLKQEAVEKNRTETDLQNCIFLFDIRGINSLQLELFTKFLFQLIADNSRNGARRLFAVYFDNSLNQQEFIRLFAIFYNRVGRLHDNRAFRGAQVALCSTHSVSSEPLRQVPEVNLVLNAKNWNSLFESARQFAYCNLESAQKVFSQIRYFADCDIKASEVEGDDASLFPFDLFLNDNMGIPQDVTSAITVAETSQCWFMQRIAQYMQVDLQQNQFGIKLSDSDFYLRSNIHLESFYQAELLFHNIAYVWRFAYLVARRLLGSGYPFKNYFLVCYEAYSSLLVQHIAKYLKSADSHAEVEYAIMYQKKTDEVELLMPELLKQYGSLNFCNDWGFTCLYPIGTTLSTIHTMHECIEQEFQIEVDSSNMKDVVLILVSPDVESLDLQKRYLESNPNANTSSLQQARIQLLSRYGNEKWDVDYFLIARTHWHDPLASGVTDRGKPLVHTDVTSTQLNMIFPPKVTDHSIVRMRKKSPKEYWNRIHQHDVCSMLSYSEYTNNDKRLALLETCIYYGHIAKDSNHYSFYLNFPRYYELLKTEENLSHYTDWLGKLRKNAVDPNAFNIIVTPLRSDRSPLLTDLANSVFAHSAHILQLDLHNARRTDVRTKYRFIAEECAELIHNDPAAQINVYYVDSSIVTTETLHRGLSLIQMLLRDRIPTEKEIHLYQGIFVLVNRSSKDTIQPFVKNPHTDYHVFVHLALPHYNTRSSVCPSCKRVEKYKMLAWRSATNAFVEEYQRLIEKEKMRTRPEFEKWQVDLLWQSPGAFLRFRQWIYHNPEILTFRERLLKETKPVSMSCITAYLNELQHRFYNEFCHSIDILEDDLVPILCGKRTHIKYSNDEIQQMFLTALDQLCLCDLVSPDDYKNKRPIKLLEEVWIDCVVGGQALRRLMSTHHAYSYIPLETESGDPNTNHDDTIQEMKEIIVKYLEEEMSAKQLSPVDRWEHLHSCLKVMSRDNLARHRTVREAIFDLLHDAADLMLGINQNDSMLRRQFSVESSSVGVPSLNNKKCRHITPLLRYQMFLCILRRLSDMQSSYPVVRLSDNKIPAQLDELLKLFFDPTLIQKSGDLDALFCCPVPSRRRMLFAYEKCVKLTTMAGDEKNKSMLIQRTYKYTP